MQVGWSDPAKSEPMLAKIPLGRFAEVEDVVNCIVFLLSGKSAMVNGVTLPIDGGFLATWYVEIYSIVLVQINWDARVFASLLIQNVHFLNCKITPHSINWMLELIKFTPHFIHPQVWNMIWQHSIIDYWSHWVTVYEHSSY